MAYTEPQTSELWPQFPAEFTFDADDLQDTPR